MTSREKNIYTTLLSEEWVKVVLKKCERILDNHYGEPILLTSNNPYNTETIAKGYRSIFEILRVECIKREIAFD